MERQTAESPCVLVVDDNHDAADILCVLVRMWGYRCEVAYDGATAWKTALAQRPAVILLDLGLPDTDGWELARRLRAEPALRHVVLVAVSGYDRDNDRERSRQVGFHHHLLKPADPEVLQQILAGLLSPARQVNSPAAP
jgi:CheY-like chemotaxis protein